jgi:hypothetical protein
VKKIKRVKEREMEVNFTVKERGKEGERKGDRINK